MITGEPPLLAQLDNAFWRSGAGRSADGVGRREGEVEAGTAMGGFVVRCDAPAVSFDDRPADGEAHAHAGFLGREEAVQEAIETLGSDARAAVLDKAGQP